MSTMVDDRLEPAVVANPPPATQPTGRLLSGITDDAGTLISQHASLFVSEMREGLGTAKWCLIAVAVGAGAVALGGAFVALGLVKGLALAGTGLPEWACWLVVGGGLLVLGAVAALTGARYVVRVSLVPTRTLKSLAESWSWLTKRPA